MICRDITYAKSSWALKPFWHLPFASERHQEGSFWSPWNRLVSNAVVEPDPGRRGQAAPSLLQPTPFGGTQAGNSLGALPEITLKRLDTGLQGGRNSSKLLGALPETPQRPEEFSVRHRSWVSVLPPQTATAHSSVGAEPTIATFDELVEACPSQVMVRQVAK